MIYLRAVIDDRNHLMPNGDMMIHLGLSTFRNNILSVTRALSSYDLENSSLVDILLEEMTGSLKYEITRLVKTESISSRE